MTDKQIIIDGIDVSGCEYYQYDMCTATKDNYGDCSYYCKDYEMKDCYFKQLSRKTQECDELKDKIKYMKEYIKTVENARDELERENKFSKEQAEQKLERIRKICLKYKTCRIILKDTILQIIDEVE